MKPLELPSYAYKDQKKLARFINDVHIMMNKLLKACQQQSKLTAVELLARPTYSEEFQNLRSSLPKAVSINQDGSYSDLIS